MYNMNVFSVYRLMIFLICCCHMVYLCSETGVTNILKVWLDVGNT